jgi:hypothetical protein
VSDQFLQVVEGLGNTTAQATLTGVTSGSTIIAFLWDGSAFSPTTHTVSDDRQGAYTAGASAADSGDFVIGYVFYLESASSGTHVITGTVDSTNAVRLYAVEIGGSGVGSVTNTQAAFQSNPGTGTDAVSSGTVTVSGASTLVSMSADTGSTSTANEPTANASSTSRLNNANGDIGAYRIQTRAVSTNTAGTFTAVAGTDPYVTLAASVRNLSTTTPSLGQIPQAGPGIGPSKRFIFTPRRLSQQIIGADVTVALVGSSLTISQGQISPVGGDIKYGQIKSPGPGISPDYLKEFNAGIRALRFGYSSTATTSVALSGSSITISQGLLTPSSQIPLVGSSLTITQGALAPSLSVSLIGQPLTISQGQVVANITVALTGQSVTTSAGTFTPVLSIALTGRGAVITSGALVPSTSVQLTGQTLTFNPGTITTSGGDIIIQPTSPIVGFICNVGTLIDRQ